MSENQAETNDTTKPAQPAQPAQPAAPKTFRGRALHVWREKVRPIVILVIVLTSFRSAVADWNDVPTGSMKPSIVEGDRIFVNKLAYGLKVPFTTWHVVRWAAPQRGEVVVFNSAEGVRLVKRVIGLPGDVIELRDGRLFINGAATEYRASDASWRNALSVDERRANLLKTEVLGDHPHPVMQNQWTWDGRARYYKPMQVPEGHYFMMGDNRDNSRDSRFPEVGVVPLNQILGRSSRVAMSFDYERWYLPRWDRFFKPLP